MKFQLKALVAALALAAVAAPAQAAMDQTSTGASSLVLTLLDRSSSISATFDLGVTKATFNQLANSSWNLGAGDYSDAWSSFWSTSTGAVEYAVFAGDSIGDLPGDKSIFTTVSSTWKPVLNNQIGAMGSAFDQYISANNNAGNHLAVGGVANGASTMTAGLGFGGSVYSSAGQINKQGGDMTGAIGTNMNVFNVVTNGSGALKASTATPLNNAGFSPYFNMSDKGALTYTAVTAVPEADTSAMMLIGLGLMGFMARRRNKAV